MGRTCVIGVDLGGTKLLAGLVDEELRVHHRSRRPVSPGDAAAVLESVELAVREALEAAAEEVSAVGVGIPSLIDRSRGVSVTSVHQPLGGVAFEALMSERLGLPVLVDNDANCAALAEQRSGAAAGARVALVLTVGTGIGGGIVIDGALFHGAQGAAGEVGHVVVDPEGRPCACGSRGCLETMASGPALAREGARRAAERSEGALAEAGRAAGGLTGALVTELAHDGDPDAIDAVRTIGRRLGIGLAGFVNVLNPDVIVVGGGVMAAGELLLEPAREEVARLALAPSRDHVRIVPARFGEEAGMLGAAVLALDRLASPASA